MFFSPTNDLRESMARRSFRGPKSQPTYFSYRGQTQNPNAQSLPATSLVRALGVFGREEVDCGEHFHLICIFLFCFSVFPMVTFFSFFVGYVMLPFFGGAWMYHDISREY